MTQRYFVEQPIAGDSAVLAGSEAHHLLHVMRLHTGDQVTLFDGSGAEFTASIARLGRAEVDLAVLSRQEISRELSLAVTLAVALPKGDRQRWLVEKAVELGVSRLLPLETARGVAQPEPQSLDRLRRTVIEASKQSGRNRLMEILSPVDWTIHAAGSPVDTIRWMAHFGGEPIARIPASLTAAAVEFSIGPEGGFTEQEVTMGRAAGWRTVDLGSRILRVETAAVLLSAVAALQA